MHTLSQHMCLVDTETTKVPALDLYENSKLKNKNLPFNNYEKKLNARQKIKIWASWAVKRAVIWMSVTNRIVTKQTLSKVWVVEMTTVEGI